jgi:dUTP pyrophosphatase
MIKVLKLESAAVLPSRAHASDIGYDLTAININKRLENGVILYGTGLSVSPPDGWYTEIVPRSSLSKTGHIIANSVGVIDPHYTGELLIAVIKIDVNSPPLELPFCKFQLIIRKSETVEIEEVQSLSDTDRGSGGFGSTG